MKDLTTDVALVGAGPIGLELAVALKRAKIDYVHFDAGQIGSTIAGFPRDTRFFSSNERIAIAAVPLQSADQTKSTREQYLAYLRAVAMQFDLAVNTYERVTAIEPRGDGFRLITRSLLAEKPRACDCRRLILATGGTARPRRLGIPGEDLPTVRHELPDPHEYFRRRMLIIGGRNSAIEAALRCHHAGANVAISYRRDAFDAPSIKYWLLPEITGLIESGRIDARFLTVPTAIAPGRVTLQNRGGETTDIDADFTLVQIGYEADMSLCRMAGIELRGPQQIPAYDDQTMQSNVANLYLAGTVIGGTQSKYRVFIENCHVHIDRIIAALGGRHTLAAEPHYVRPES